MYYHIALNIWVHLLLRVVGTVKVYPTAWLLMIEHSMSIDWVHVLHSSTCVRPFQLQRQVRRGADISHVYMQGITKQDGTNNTLYYVKTA
jgi:hypothetical protein